MIVVLELAIALGLIYGATRIVLKLIDNHKELKLLREERMARLEAVGSAKEVAQELLLDKELAGEVAAQINDELGRDHLPPKSDNG